MADDYSDFNTDYLYSNYNYEDWWNADGGSNSPTYQSVYGNLGTSIDSLFGDTSGLTNLFKTSTGQTDWAKLLAGGAGLMGLYDMFKGPQKVGYQGKIPEYRFVREQVPQTYDPNRRPGSGGQRYFTDVGYATPSNLEAITSTIKEQAPTLQAANLANPARQTIPKPEEEKKAMGGIVGLAKGRYLDGSTDGMADEVPAKIGKSQPAALSHGEFVIPADVVSHLGNGNSNAGAKKLYEMMDRIRSARTGTEKQGKQINPNKYLPK
jgi:hypothetical protein